MKRPRSPCGSRRAERRGELSPAANVELAVDVAQVPLDVLDGDEQRVRDLPVALPRAGELRHALLAGRETARLRDRAGRSAPTREPELLAGGPGQRAGADRVGQDERLAQ